jgi:putative SOS response-associated peptidase YedK
MCGRMTLTRSGSEIADYFALAMAEDEIAEMNGEPLRARYNIAPSQQVATIVGLPDGGRSLTWKKWGLVPSWSMDQAVGGRLFNARSETADEKPSFRAAWKRRRCLVVADGFYEWTKQGRRRQPYHFSAHEGSLLGLAGLFEQWSGEGGEVVESCTVLTTDANPDLEGIHHRMPVILDSTRFGSWLDPASETGLLKAMMVPARAGTLDRKAVSTRVNSPRFDDPQCLMPEPESPPEPEPEPKAVQGDLFGTDGERTK